MTHAERMTEIKGEHIDRIGKPIPDDCDVCYLFARVEKLKRLAEESKALVSLVQACASGRDLYSELSTQAQLVGKILAACEEENDDA